MEPGRFHLGNKNFHNVDSGNKQEVHLRVAPEFMRLQPFMAGRDNVLWWCYTTYPHSLTLTLTIWPLSSSPKSLRNPVFQASRTSRTDC